MEDIPLQAFVHGTDKISRLDFIAFFNRYIGNMSVHGAVIIPMCNDYDAAVTGDPVDGRDHSLSDAQNIFIVFNRYIDPVIESDRIQSLIFIFAEIPDNSSFFNGPPEFTF